MSSSTSRAKRLPDGTIAETNLLWLGGWHLECLNTFYLRLFDHRFYQSLESPVATSLHEILGLRFQQAEESGQACVRYRYSSLCQLPPSQGKLSSPRPRKSLRLGIRSSKGRIFGESGVALCGRMTGFGLLARPPGPCGRSRRSVIERNRLSLGLKSMRPKLPRKRPMCGALLCI